MTDSRKSEPGPGRVGFNPGARRALRVSRGELTRDRYFGDSRFPLVVEPTVDGLNLAAWLEDHREETAGRLLDHGAVLFRGFAVDSVEAFEDGAKAFSPALLDYRERAAPRQQVGARVYTSTEFPANQPIPLHHEMSYSHNWPARIWFYCVQPASEGGRTPITEDRALFERLDPEVRREFQSKRVMYVRNYGAGVDLTWQDAFQVERREEVEAYCRDAGIAFEWRDGDRLRTRQVRQAVATHPETGDIVWFNHAHMFHVSSLPRDVQAALLAQFAEDELPRHARFGDGSPIDPAALDHIRETYEREAVRFEWQRGDVLLLDNFLCAHGREPFTGSRRIVVAMSDLYTHREP